jgi:hypothetical protein
MKHKTNEQMLRTLLKNLNTIETALLRERLQMIADLTRKNIAVNPDRYNTMFTSANMYLKLCDKISNAFPQ